ncbi:MAG: GAF domain-containing protein [Chloroflexia bacterium]
MDPRERFYPDLLDLSTRLVETLDEEEVAAIATSFLGRVLKARCCAVIHLGPERAQGGIGAVYPGDAVAGRTLSPAESLALTPFLGAETVCGTKKGSDAGVDLVLEHFGCTAALLYPLSVDENEVRLIFLGFARPEDMPPPDEILRYEPAVRQIASAWKNARLYQKTHRRLRTLHLLHDVALAVTTLTDLDALVDQTLELLCRHLKPDRCALLQVHWAERLLRAHPASRGLSVSAEEATFSLDQEACGWAARNGRPLLVSDTGRDPRCPRRKEVGSQLCVPVTVRGQVVAVLDLGSRRTAAFGQEDLEALREVAGYLAAAMEREESLRESQQRVRELSALMRVSAALQRATRLEEILEVTLSEAFNLLGREHGSILLLDREANCLRIAASRGLPEDLVAELNRRGIPTTFGTFALILRTGEMLEIPDTSTDPRVESGYGPVPPQLTNVPLKTEQRVLGILVLDAVPPDEASRRMLLALANMAALAIERTWLFEETRRRLEEVRFLQEVALAATSTLDFDEVLRRSVEALQRWLQFEVFGFLVVDERAGLLHLHPAFVGVPEELHGFTIPIGEGITGWVAQTGEPYVCADVQSNGHYYDAVPGIRSEICVPVKSGERVIAVIDVESVRPNAFGENELRLLSAMAHQLAIALENAQRYSREQEQRRLAEAMRRIAWVLGSTLDVDELLNQALSCLEQLLPYRAAFLVLLREGRVDRVRVRGGAEPPPSVWLTPGTLPARIYVERRSILVPDTRQEPSWKPWPGAEDLRSWIGVPFLAKEELFGLLLIGASEPHTYGREEATAAFTFAGQLSLALERARFYEQERRRAEQLDLLHRIGQRVVGMMEAHLLLEEATRCLHEALQPLQTSLALVEEDELVILTARGPLVAGAGLSRTTVPLESPGILPWVARKGVPILVPDVTADARFPAAFYSPEVRAEMAVPLRAKNRVVGVLDVQGSRPGEFDESDLATLQAVGMQIGGALERAYLYAELRETVEQLRQTDRLRNDFLSAINHEMRAPLTAILGFADFLLREQAGPLTPAQREYLGDIRAGGERILSLVNNILEAARLEEGQVLPRWAEVHLEGIVAQVLAMLRPAAMEKEISLASRLPPDLPSAWADPVMVERILTNLLSNAIKFTPSGGSVWVEAGVSTRQPHMLEVSVSDTGVGIDPRYVGEIFQRYRRLETPGLGRVSGTGLGLYIVKGLVEAHGGQIEVRSAPGEGSTFTFTLPMFRESGE